MNHFSDQSTIPANFTATILLCLATSVFAQPPDPAVGKVAEQLSNTSQDDDELKQGSHRSLMLTRSQSVIQCMDLVREAMGRKDYLGAIPLMERVLSEPNSFVPVDAMTEVAAHEEVRRLVSQMPADLRKRLDEQRSAEALRKWEQVRTAQRETVVAFLRQYLDLPIAVDAWWWLGLSERDHGRGRMAAAAFLKIADHPRSSNLQRVVALIAAYETLQTDRISIRERIAKVDPQMQIQFGDHALQLSQWLNEHPIVKPIESANDDAPLADMIQSRSNRPVVLPVWKQQFNLAQNNNVIAQEQRKRALGVKPIPLTRPLIVGDRVITRNLDAIYAYSFSTGVAQWISSNTEYRDLESLGVFSRIANQSAVVDWIQRRTQADSIFSRMSTDGPRLFVIQEPDRAREFGHDRQPLRGGFRSGPRFNKLVAYRISDGTLEWEIGGGKSAYTGEFFLGSPFVLDETLFVVVQRETEVVLHAIQSENGFLLWSKTLGDVLLPVSEDLQRSRVACPITYQDGLLLVSTGAGAVVAVDPVLQSLVWGYRYPARTISAADLLKGQNSAETQQVQESWWENWREPFLQAARIPSSATKTSDNPDSVPSQSGILIFVSPETDLIHAIQLPDGKVLWREPRDGGLMVAGIVENRLIVIEGEFVRAHDLETGRQIWRTPTTEVSGPIATTGAMLVVPLLSGGTMLLDARTGQTVADSSNSDAPLGTLMETDGGWIACSRQSLMRLPRLREVREEVIRELQATPDVESLRVRAAFLDLQAGDFESARGRLEGLQSTPARELRSQALIDALRDIGTRRSNSNRSDLARQLMDLAEHFDSRSAAAMAIGSSALAVSDYPAAVEAALDGLSADLDQSEGLVKTDGAIVRKDRVLLGLIDEVYRRAPPESRTALDDLFQSRLKDARNSKDWFAVQQLARQWRGLDWSRNLVVTEEEKTLRKRSPAEIELRLLDAAGSQDRAIARLALERLASRFEGSGSFQDAWAVQKRIQAEFLSSVPTNGALDSNRPTQTPQEPGRVTKRTKSAWPKVDPIWESIDDRHFGVYSLVPVHAEPGSLAERLDVWIDRNGKEILFRGDSFFQSGQDENDEPKLTLPSSTSPYRNQLGYMLREGWGIGRIVILLVGSELFAISPLDDQREPNSKILWSIELGPPPENSRVLKGHANINNGYEFLVDQSNRQIGKVGPVRANYFCYQKGNRLVAAETETGKELWERYDPQADACLLGDDQQVYLWRENALEVLSAVDGRKIEDRVCRVSSSNLILQSGSLAWTVSRSLDLQLELNDLRTGQLVWSRTEHKNARVATLDQETIAVATTEGKLFLMEARTGRELCQPLPVKSQSTSQIVTWNDSERWYVVLGSPAEGFPALKSKQWYDSYRKPNMNGTLYCIDRFDPKVIWQREIKNEPIALDQSKIAPILVQLWKKGASNQNSPLSIMLIVTDKLTGKLLAIKPNAGQQAYFLLNPDLQQAIVELRLERETIRIRYDPDHQKDAIDANQKAGEKSPSE